MWIYYYQLKASHPKLQEVAEVKRIVIVPRMPCDLKEELFWYITESPEAGTWIESTIDY